MEAAGTLQHLDGHDLVHGRDRVADAVRVGVEESVDRQPRALPLRVAFLGRLLRGHHDVLAAEPADAVQRLARSALADREHRDDAADAEDEAEHREEAAQLVEEEVLHAERDVAAESGQRKAHRISLTRPSRMTRRWSA